MPPSLSLSPLTAPCPLVGCRGYTVASFSGGVLRLLGFQKHRSASGRVTYWFRPALEAQPLTPPQRPCVFVHGLGVGLAPYLAFLRRLSRCHAGPLVVVELRHIALQLRTTLPTIDSLVADLLSIHARHALGPATYIAHSYGSLLVSRVAKVHPHLVAQLGLVDPVCFLLCLPDTIFNFFYRTPGDWGDWGRWYLCSKEGQVARVLSRGFDWQALQLWGDEMEGRRVVVMLAGRDSIVPAAKVKRHLEGANIPVVYNADFRHAEYLGR